MGKRLENAKSLYLEAIREGNVVGCRNFVAALSKMNLGGSDMAVIDIFRVENTRMVEHWDVMEEIQPQETWVNSGKF